MDTSTTNIFETASRSKLRFAFKGVIGTEELWDMSVETLDLIFKTLNAQARMTNEESLLGTKTRQEEELLLKIEIVKHIVKTKLDEAEARLKIQEKRQKRQEILETKANKEKADLAGKSLEELDKMLEELN